MSKTIVLIIYIILIFFISCSDQTASQSKQIDIFVSECFKMGLFNGTVLVASNDQVIYKGAFGFRDLETREPLTTGSAFYLASVSKQFTTMAIMMLKERGILTYDDTLDKFFPAFPDYAKSITIRHLMTHTSAIPDHFSLFEETDGLTNQQVLNRLVKVKNLAFQPGEKYEYSNGAYVMLSLIVSQVSGQPFPEFMQENIFVPLSMTHTLVYDQSEPLVAGRVTGYDLYEEKNDYTLFTSGAGGMYTSVEDLYRWDRALYTDKLVSQQTLKEAYTPYILSDDTSTGYGFGWRIIEDEFGKRVQHSGGLAGFSTYIERHLDQNYTIIFLNSRGLPMPWMSSGIRHILRNQPFELPKMPISLKLHQLLKESDINAVIEQYHIFKRQDAERYDFREYQLNRYGYYLLEKQKIKEAIAIFKLNREEYPNSANVYDSLGDGYSADRQLDKAAENYRLAYQRAREINDPDSLTYKQNLERVLKQE